MPFRFIVVTGCNGVGKSTVIEALRERIGAATFHYPAEFVRFRDAVALDSRVSARPRLLYYLAATLQLSDLVTEQLGRGHVVCDRYLESPLSLMIATSALTESEVESWCAPYRPYLLRQDLTLLLTAGFETACARIRARRPAGASSTEQLALESRAFFEQREGVLRRQAARAGPLRELDTTSSGIPAMCEAAWQLVRPLLAQNQPLT